MILPYYNCEKEGCKGKLFPIGINSVEQLVFECNTCGRRMKTDCNSCENHRIRNEQIDQTCGKCRHSKSGTVDNWEYDLNYNSDIYPELFLLSKKR